MMLFSVSNAKKTHPSIVLITLGFQEGVVDNYIFVI